MFALKKISREFIPKALEKAEKYRLMNHPKTTESICLDVLEIDPGNQQVLVLLIQAITEQFGHPQKYSVNIRDAQKWLPQLSEEYSRLYCQGLILERWAKAKLADLPGSDLYAYLAEAIALYEKAEPLAPAGDQSCLLHYNLCVRFMQRHPCIQPEKRS